MSNQILSQKHIIYFVIFILLTFYTTAGFANQDKHPKINEEAPSFTLESLQGDNLTLADYHGKFVVIHFATSW